MATIVNYNGVELHSVKTLRWEQDVQYDDSHTDKLFNRFKLQFEGLLHTQNSGDAPVWMGVSANAGSMAEAYTAIRRQLSAPRQGFQVTMGDQVILKVDSCEATTVDRDVDNGPKPGNIQITHVTSNAAIGPVFKVTFDIECAITDCGTGFIPYVLNNRWSIQESLDDKFFTTRTIHGKLRLSDSSKITPEMYRSICVPGLEGGFRRDRIDFTTSANGMEADYVVTDRQIHTAAPWPAAKCDVRHTAATKTGSSFMEDCHVRLEGMPAATKGDLFSLAIKIIEDRVTRIAYVNSQAENGDTYTVDSCALTSYTGENNIIEAFLRVTHTLIDTDVAGGMANVSNGSLFARLGSIAPITLPNGEDYDPQKSHVPAIWGYDPMGDQEGRAPAAYLLLMHCYLQVPCSPPHAIYGAGSTQSSDTPESVEYPPTQVYQHDTGSTLPQTWASPNLSESQKTSMYTIAAVETKFNVATQRVQLTRALDGSAINEQTMYDDTCVVAQLGAPTATMERLVDAERCGQWPEIPMPDATWERANNMKGSLLHFFMNPRPPTLGNDAAQKIFRLSARYVYALNRPPTFQDKLNIGAMPFASFTTADNEFSIEAIASETDKFGE